MTTGNSTRLVQVLNLLTQAERLCEHLVGEREAREVVSLPPQGCPLEEIEREAVYQALEAAHWVQKDAAKLLGISPRVMNYKIRTLDIEFPSWCKWKRHEDEPSSE